MKETRTIKVWADANTCKACRALPDANGRPTVTLATHSVTDSHEVQPGVFEEGKPRFGCQTHKVAAMVYYLSGDCKPLSEVLVCQ